MSDRAHPRPCLQPGDDPTAQVWAQVLVSRRSALAGGLSVGWIIVPCPEVRGFHSHSGRIWGATNPIDVRLAH